MSDEELSARVLMEVRTLVESLERRYAAFSQVQETLRALKQKIG